MYTFCTSTLGISPNATISAIGLFPVTLLFTYAFLLPRPAEAGQVEGELEEGEQEIVDLPLKAKLNIVKPMFLGFMAPLAALMLVEYTTVQVYPTLGVRKKHALNIITTGRPPDPAILSPIHPCRYTAPGTTQLGLPCNARFLSGVCHGVPVLRLPGTLINLIFSTPG